MLTSRVILHAIYLHTAMVHKTKASDQIKLSHTHSISYWWSYSTASTSHSAFLSHPVLLSPCPIPIFLDDQYTISLCVRHGPAARQSYDLLPSGPSFDSIFCLESSSEIPSHRGYWSPEFQIPSVVKVSSLVDKGAMRVYDRTVICMGANSCLAFITFWASALSSFLHGKRSC